MGGKRENKLEVDDLIGVEVGTGAGAGAGWLWSRRR